MPSEIKQAAQYSSAKNRRFYSRREVRSLAYVDLGRDNGGIVLNLSEGGLAIHSAITLNERRLPHVRFQLPQSSAWAEARGEVAWTSDNGMQAGIQLIGLDEQARRQIREWVCANGRPVSANAAPSDILAGQPIATAPRLQVPPTPPMPPEPPLPPISAKRDAAAISLPPTKSEIARAVFTSVLPLNAPSKSKEAERKAPAIAGGSKPVRSSGSELSLLLGQAAQPSKSRPVWITWLAFGLFLAAMAILSFSAGLRTGRGDSRSLLSGLFGGAQSDSASAQESQAVTAVSDGETSSSTGTALVGRVTVTSRMYVPMAIPLRPDAAKTERLQVGAIDHRVDPQYPADAQSQHTEGTVQLHATIGANGSVENIASLSGPPALVQAATDAVRQWRFKPTLVDGKAIETEADIAVVFWLRPAAPHPQGGSK